ncbi:hypothetical protein D7147_02825 [Micromonospora musae]|uniref:Uncharacterized protein n=1 Tax=Micromonospora musae TaxID=1894970 RepID=A0ABX9RJ91_9ACTN|nr:hypothetical protein [Micromonospora musae]RKN23966.1 hypothetical protein D7147_02825 [Micromonospora musae]
MMNEDEVLDAVKQTLSDVRMERPVEAIQQRGRERRRNRKLFGVAAGGGLAAVVALALALPTAAAQPDATPTDTGPVAGSSGTTAMEPAAFTLARQADSTVKLTLNYRQLLDPAALKSALADAGVPAEVKTHAICTPEGKELPQADQVYSNKRVNWPDGSPKQYDMVIAPAKMPKNSRLYFSVFSIRPGEEYAKIANYLVSNDDPMKCGSEK